MFKSRFMRMRHFTVLLLVLIFAASAYAFAATNTVAGSKAGDGTGVISGFDITAIDYTLDAADPTDIDQVDFTLDTAPVNGKVYIELNSVGGTWFECTVAGTAATCDTTGSAVPLDATLTSLRVVAVD